MIKLLPRKYKIEQDLNEYTYFVVWLLGGEKPWAIEFSAGRNCLYMTKNLGLGMQCADTAYFDTPEEALKFWEKYMNAKSPQIKQAIESIVAFLKKNAGEEDMASVQINNSGSVILRNGVSQMEYLSIDELIAIMGQN